MILRSFAKSYLCIFKKIIYLFFCSLLLWNTRKISLFSILYFSPKSDVKALIFFRTPRFRLVAFQIRKPGLSRASIGRSGEFKCTICPLRLTGWKAGTKRLLAMFKLNDISTWFWRYRNSSLLLRLEFKVNNLFSGKVLLKRLPF